MKNNIGGVPFANYLWNGNQIVGWFFLFSILVITFAWINIKIIKIISVKFKIPSSFMGGVVLALYTSLPEFITGVFAGVVDGQNNSVNGAIFSLYNVTGANVLQIFILAVFSVYVFIALTYESYRKHKKQDADPSWWKKRGKFTYRSSLINYFMGKGSVEELVQTNYLLNWNQGATNNLKRRVHKKPENQNYTTIINSIIKENWYVWTVVLIEYVLMIASFASPKFGEYLNVNGFNFLNFIFFIFWLIFIVITLRQKGDDLYDVSLEKSIFWKINKWWVLPIFILFSGMLSLFAYLNSGIVDEFESVLKIPANAASGFILSFATSLPEITSFTILVYKKNYTTAAAGILGSSIFNLTIPFFTNIISLNGLYGNRFSQELVSGNTNALKLLPWSILSIIMLIVLGLYTNKKVAGWKRISATLALILAIGYIVGFVLISLYPNI